MKWDGYRIAVHIEPGRVRILTRGGYDWTGRFSISLNDIPEVRHICSRFPTMRVDLTYTMALVRMSARS